MYLSGGNSTALLILILFLIILLIYESITIPLYSYRSNREIENWTNTIPAKIVGIRVEKHYFRRMGPRVNEWPTLQYTVNNVCYQKEYMGGAGRKGSFRCGDTVYIRYSDNAPEIFIIECDCKARHWKAHVLQSAIVIPLCLIAAVYFSLLTYLENHAFLFLEYTWTDMEHSFDDLKSRNTDNTNDMKALGQAVSDTLAYHDKLEYQISLTNSPKKKLEYQARLEDSTYKAGSSLADYYADYTGQFLYRCGKTELRTLLRDSMLYQFLSLVQGSSYTGPVSVYTMEDLEFFGQTAAQLGSKRQAGSRQPEEALGLAMAATEVKLQTAMEVYGISPAMNQTLSGLLPGYWDSRLSDLDRQLDNTHDPITCPLLDYSAVWTIHAYMLERYNITGDFETSVLDTCTYAGNHLENRRRSQHLQSAVRCLEDANPFTDFSPEDLEPQTAEEILSFAPVSKNAARDLLKNWDSFTYRLDSYPPSLFDLCLILAF